jgi:GntR family transcriptional repressor for pyruvate dehydrogenase complex
MEFSKLSAPTLKELFIHELENRILSGKLEIGSQLPSERELADMMQVSRTVVNAGIVEMAKKGFLIIKPRIGTFVSDYRRNGTLETFISIMGYNGGMLRKSEIKSILEVRMVLDSLAVQTAIPKITTEELAVLKAILEQLQDTVTPEKAAELAFNFHHELNIISGNIFLPLLFSSSKFPICSLWERYCRIHGIKSLYQNTAALYQRIENKDVSGAIESINHTMQEIIDGKRQIYSE